MQYFLQQKRQSDPLPGRPLVVVKTRQLEESEFDKRHEIQSHGLLVGHQCQRGALRSIHSSLTSTCVTCAIVSFAQKYLLVRVVLGK